MNFGEAIKAAKNGAKIQRMGWNGKSRWRACHAEKVKAMPGVRVQMAEHLARDGRGTRILRAVRAVRALRENTPYHLGSEAGVEPRKAPATGAGMRKTKEEQNVEIGIRCDALQDAMAALDRALKNGIAGMIEKKPADAR